MTHHLHREIDRLKQKLLGLSAVVESSVELAVEAVKRRDERLAQRVIDQDERIDRSEVEVEEECLKILALHQPVAIDLRFIVAVLKINNDLERIGDLAVNIAERVPHLRVEGDAVARFDFSEMSAKVMTMLRESLAALINMDTARAFAVCAADDEIDAMHRAMYRRVAEALQARPADADVLMQLHSVSRQLERIADYATNIAEDIIYMTEGEIVRHRVEQFARGGAPAPSPPRP